MSNYIEIESSYKTKKSTVIKTEIELCTQDIIKIKAKINKVKDRSDFLRCSEFNLCSLVNIAIRIVFFVI